MSSLAGASPSATAAAEAPVAASDRFNTLACLTVGTAILGYCLAEPAPGLAAFSVPILGLGWWLGRRGEPIQLPRPVINLLVLATVARAVFTVAGSGNAVVSHLTEFLVLIQLIKLFDRRTPRDDGQLLSLSLFVVIGALLTSNALGVGLLLALYAPLATASAMLLQIRAGLLRARQAVAVTSEEATSPAPMSAQMFTGRDGRRARRQFAGTVAAAVAMSFVLAAFAFLVTPRGFGADRLGGFGRVEPRASIGFTDEVRLWGVRPLDTDHTPVMDVLVRESSGRNAGAESLPLYLRGATLDEYEANERSWRNSRPYRLGASRTINVPPDFPLDLAPVPTGRVLIEQEITLRASPRRGFAYLFAMWSPVRIQFPEEQNIGRLPSDSTMRLLESPGGRFRYTVWSLPEGTTDAGVHYRPRLGFQSGPVRDLAVQILSQRGIGLEAADRQAGDNRAAAAALQHYLRQNYRYTLDPMAPGPREDPIEKFLFQTKEGHCEYFASALVALCQSVGIQARVVTGYLTNEFNRVTGQYLVRQSHAHAWAEINLDGAGDSSGRWQTLDATPAGDLERLQRARTGLFGRLRHLYDAIDFAWNDAVVSFDERKRADILGGFFARSEALASLRALASRVARALTSSLDPVAVGTRTWLAMGAVCLGGALVLFLIPRLRTRMAGLIRRRGGTGRLDPELRRLLAEAGFYDRALAMLERAGLAKPASRPPLAHADALTHEHPQAGELLRSLASIYYKVRFGRRPLSATDRTQAAELLADLHSAMGRR